MSRIIALFTLCISIAFGAANAADANPKKLRVALLPDENASTVIKNNQPLEQYLEGKLGLPIELVVTTDYSSMIEAMRHGRLELAYFGPLSYVLARSKSNIEPFAALRQKGSTTYQSVVIANVGAGIARIADARGRNIAYGDKASTSSHLIPKSIIAEAGLQPGSDYKEHFVGAHDAVAIAVQNGHAQIGGLSKPIFESLVERKMIDPAKVRVLSESKPFPQYPWVMRSDLNADLKARIRDAFLTLNDPAVLKPFKADGFGPIGDKDYDVVRELARILNLDLSKF